MADPLLIVDVQEGFINDFTRHIPGRIKTLIERDDYAPLLYTRCINGEGRPFRRSDIRRHLIRSLTHQPIHA